MNLTVFQLPTRRTETVTLGDWYIKALAAIKTLSNEPSSSINAIVGYTLNKSRHFGISHPGYELSLSELYLLDTNLNQLVAGKPLPYITGKQEFYGFDFKTSPAVLIPRPETELLVEHALSWLTSNRGKNLAADVGIGSGCISISIIKNHPNLSFIGTDISFNSLFIAQENLRAFKLDGQIRLVQTDLLSGINCEFDLICANLPYISSDILSSLAVREHEPHSALDGGQDGLAYISALISQSQSKIRKDGLILLEIESSQSQAVLFLANEVFPNSNILLIYDLAGLPRLVKIELNGT
jgi:release factor glutamine methyltransferase